MQVINTTGDVRKAAGEILVKVLEGTIKLEDARTAHKLVHVINDSFFAEAKIAMLQLQLQQEVKKFGTMELSPDNVVPISKAA